MSWQSWEEAANEGPAALAHKGCGFAILVVIPIVLVLGCLMGSIGYIGGWFSETAQVAREQLGPRALLTKYEWFKDASASLDAKLASIQVYEGRFSRLKAEYLGKTRSEWSREDREQANLWESEVAGIKASYNRLAGEYNAAMAKANYQFCNVGEVPAGGKPLPREYRAYAEQ